MHGLRCLIYQLDVEVIQQSHRFDAIELRAFELIVVEVNVVIDRVAEIHAHQVALMKNTFAEVAAGEIAVSQAGLAKVKVDRGAVKQSQLVQF